MRRRSPGRERREEGDVRTSLRTSLLGPRRRMVQAFGFSQSTKKEKYSSPIFSTWKTPHCVPTWLSCSSLGLLRMVAPVTLAMRLLSVFLILLRAVTPAFQQTSVGCGIALALLHLHEVVLSKIRDSLLGDDHVRLYCKNLQTRQHPRDLTITSSHRPRSP